MADQVSYRDVPGFPGYRVGDDGSVWGRRARGLAKSPPRHWHMLKQFGNAARGHIGYATVHVVGPNGIKHLVVHKLVLMAFVGAGAEDEECRHLNGNPMDCRLSNLVWGTALENAADREKHGHTRRNERHGMSKVTWKQVEEIRADPRTNRSAIGRDYGLTSTQVKRIQEHTHWRKPC